MSPEELERLELNPSLRIKFASLDDKGRLSSDAGEEYNGFFADMPPGWIETGQMTVKTRYEHDRTAHVLRYGKAELAIVKHETGAEVILLGLGINFASEAIVGLVVWGWNRWKQRRAAVAAGGVAKVEPTLVLEGVVERDPASGSKEIARAEAPGLQSGEEIGEYVSKFIKRLQSPAIQDIGQVAAAPYQVHLTFNFHLSNKS
jgi:hypothetical protein